MYCLNQRVFYKQEENDNETVGKCSCSGPHSCIVRPLCCYDACCSRKLAMTAVLTDLLSGKKARIS